MKESFVSYSESFAEALIVKEDLKAYINCNAFPPKIIIFGLQNMNFDVPSQVLRSCFVIFQKRYPYINK